MATQAPPEPESPAVGAQTPESKEPPEERADREGEPARAPDTDVPDEDDDRDEEKAPTEESLEDRDTKPEDRRVPQSTLNALYGRRAKYAVGQADGVIAIGDGATSIREVRIGMGAPGVKAWNTRLRWPGGNSGYAPISEECDRLIQRRLTDYGVACLTGAPGSGRYTAAALALGMRHGFDELAEIRIKPDVTMFEAVTDENLLSDGCGHLLQQDVSIDPTHLAKLGELAAERKATVIVIQDGADDVRRFEPFQVSHRPPEPERVFGVRLDHLIRVYRKGCCIGECGSCQGRCVEDYVLGCERHSGVREALRATVTCHDVVELAERIAERIPRHEQLDAILAGSRHRLRSHAAKLLRPRPLPDSVDPVRSVRHQQAFRLAYAVLDGHPISDVFDATEWLMRVLDDAAGVAAFLSGIAGPGADDRPVGWPVFRHGVAELAGDGLVGDESADQRPPTAGVARRARMANPQLTEVLLDVAWHDFDNSQRPLLGWLDRLAADRRKDIRRSGASVAGRLADFDFVRLFDELVDGWASSPQHELRQAAAWACYVAAAGGLLDRRVGRRVEEWARRGSSYQRDTAARVYATGFGRDVIAHALDDLYHVAVDRTQRRSLSVAYALATLFDPVAVGAIVARMARWATGDIEVVRLHAGRALLLLAVRVAGKRPEEQPVPDLTGPVSRLPGEASVSGTPELLALTSGGAVDINDLATLWRAALAQPKTALRAWATIDAWVIRAGLFPASPGDDALPALVERITGDSAAVRNRFRWQMERVWQPKIPQSALLPRIRDLLVQERS